MYAKPKKVKKFIVPSICIFFTLGQTLKSREKLAAPYNFLSVIDIVLYGTYFFFIELKSPTVKMVHNIDNDKKG